MGGEIVCIVMGGGGKKGLWGWILFSLHFPLCARVSLGAY